MRGALASKGIDQDLDTFLSLRIAVCAVEELCDPCNGVTLGGFLNNVVERGGADYRLGCGLSILYCEIGTGESGPEDVEKGDGFGGFGA